MVSLCVFKTTFLQFIVGYCLLLPSRTGWWLRVRSAMLPNILSPMPLCMHASPGYSTVTSFLCCIQPKRFCEMYSAHAAPAGIRVSMKLPLMMCGICNVPARAVPETSWRREPSVPCAAPASEAPSQSDFELFMTDLCVIAIQLCLQCVTVMPVLVSMCINLRCSTMHIIVGQRVFLRLGAVSA